MHGDIEGTFTFNVKLRYTTALAKQAELSLDLSRPQPFVFTIVSSSFPNSIVFADLSLDEAVGIVFTGDIYAFSGDNVSDTSSYSSLGEYSAPFYYSNSTVSAIETRTSLTAIVTCANGGCNGTTLLT